MLINIQIGDWSNDGHGRCDTFVVESNLSAHEIERAFRAGTDSIGFNLMEHCCDYEDSHLYFECTGQLLKRGYHPPKNVSTLRWELGMTEEQFKDLRLEEDTDGWELDADSYLDIYLFICKLGNPLFEYEVREFESIKAGGYGLFH